MKQVHRAHRGAFAEAGAWLEVEQHWITGAPWVDPEMETWNERSRGHHGEHQNLGDGRVEGRIPHLDQGGQA